MVVASPPTPDVAFTREALEFALAKFPELRDWSDEEITTLWRVRLGKIFTIRIPQTVFQDGELRFFLGAQPAEEALNIALTLHAFGRKLLGRMSTTELFDDFIRISFTMKNEGD
jgi:hypothetical protein